MRICSIILVACLARLTTANGTLTVLEIMSEINVVGQIITKTLEQTRTLNKEQNSQYQEIFDTLDQQIVKVTVLQQELPKIGSLVLRLQFRNVQYYLDKYYRDMSEFVRNMENYDKDKLLSFANKVTKTTTKNSIHSIIRQMLDTVKIIDLQQLISQYYEPDTYLCAETEPLSQILLSIFIELIINVTKSYITLQEAYMIKRTFEKAYYETDAKNITKNFVNNVKEVIEIIKPNVTQATREFRRCDPKNHTENQTYIQFRNFLHGYVVDKRVLDEGNLCNIECDYFQYTEINDCKGSTWCTDQPKCPKVINCRYVDSSVTICPADMYAGSRRYQSVKYGNTLYGSNSKCPKPKNLETYLYWVFFKCSYCFCTCEEDEQHTERYINLRAAVANTTENKVVTGVRFIKHNRIVHLQIQEGKLLSKGRIDINTIKWLPPANYEITDKVQRGTDYHLVTWEEREFDLDDFITTPDKVVTGVKFTKVGQRIHLEVQTTPFNFTTGELNSAKNWFEDDPLLQMKHKGSIEFSVANSDVPTRPQDERGHPKITIRKYIKFINSDFVKDAGQTTVPFFDSQEVVPKTPVPLSGIGMIHKGRKGYGGFLTPRIFVYNFTEHLEPISDITS